MEVPVDDGRWAPSAAAVKLAPAVPNPRFAVAGATAFRRNCVPLVELMLMMPPAWLATRSAGASVPVENCALRLFTTSWTELLTPVAELTERPAVVGAPAPLAVIVSV